MRYALKEILLGTVVIGLLGVMGHAQAPTAAPAAPTKTVRAVPDFVTVTDQIIGAPKPQDWLIHRGNYEAWGYSSLDQINKANVKTLQLVWTRAMEPGINQATPLVYNGVMYLGNPGDVIQAIDAVTGDLMWEYRHPLPPASSFRANHGQRKRSIALYGDHVYTVTWDNASSRWRPAPAGWPGGPTAAAISTSATRLARSWPTAWSSRAAHARWPATVVMSPATMPGAARSSGGTR